MSKALPKSTQDTPKPVEEARTLVAHVLPGGWHPVEWIRGTRVNKQSRELLVTKTADILQDARWSMQEVLQSKGLVLFDSQLSQEHIRRWKNECRMRGCGNPSLSERDHRHLITQLGEAFARLHPNMKREYAIAWELRSRSPSA